VRSSRDRARVRPGAIASLGLAALLPLGVPRVAAAAVEVGLERCDVPGGGPLSGKRIGLLCHGASVTSDGRRSVDVLRSRGVTVVRLFAPEHGLSGRDGAGVAVGDARDPATGLPIVSLYGTRRRPALADLAGLDALVVDLQDAGVRFYTYVATAIACMEAAAEAGLPVIVLDRPNPLGGELVEGPVVDLPEAERSLVNRLPGPLVHGLTVGEMARFAMARSPKLRALKLAVVPMKGWERGMLWSDTGRPWVAPSPNLRSAEAALAYPGVALLEATNVSEGRGTDAPFLLFGAPWLSAASEVRLRAAVAGALALDRTGFVPERSEAAPEARYAGERCQGFRIRLVDGRAARPYEMGLKLLAALSADRAFEWRDHGRALDRLLGTSRVRRALVAGRSVDAIVGEDRGAIERFKSERRRVLLY
jgi:uncharacterized protein YbbC (DUF1343 family)